LSAVASEEVKERSPPITLDAEAFVTLNVTSPSLSMFLIVTAPSTMIEAIDCVKLPPPFLLIMSN